MDGEVGATPFAVCRRARRGMPSCSRCAVPPSGSGIWCASTAKRLRAGDGVGAASRQLDGPRRGHLPDQINFPGCAASGVRGVRLRLLRPAGSIVGGRTGGDVPSTLGSSGPVFDVTGHFDTALGNPLGTISSAAVWCSHRGVGGYPSAPAEFGCGCAMAATGGDRRRRRGVAADPGGLQRIVAASRASATTIWRRRVADMQLAPLFVVQRLWLDAPVNLDPAPFLGTGGLEPVDNISVVNLRAPGRRMGARPLAVWWSRCTPTRSRGPAAGAVGPRCPGRPARGDACCGLRVSIRRPPAPGSSRSASWSSGTARCSPRIVRRAAAGRTPVPDWCSPATGSGSTCR